MKIRIKKDDTVKIMSGKDKGKIGKVLKVLPKEKKIIVQGVNVVKKYIRPSQSHPEGGREEIEEPIFYWKAQLLCSHCKNPTRIGILYLETGEKVRVCKKCGEIIDKV
jgi:large subunit ribosomal protein L24